MNIHPTIGIWGFSRVGTAAARYYIQQGLRPGIFDAQPLTIEQRAYCSDHTLHVWQPDQLNSFLQTYDYILPSPGIDLRPYNSYAHKWIAEFDIFCHAYKKPIIGITGSVGKTSITHLLSQLLTTAYGSIATGGNIGIGMLDLLTDADYTNMALLELSSFQLELVQTGAPDLALITNIYPNHLDRHGTLTDYIAAKTRIYRHQTNTQKLLLPYALAPDLYRACTPQAQVYLFADTRPTHLSDHGNGIFFIEHMMIKYADKYGERELLSLHTLPRITFAQNWLMIVSAAHLLGIDLHLVMLCAPTWAMPPHRLELIDTINGVTFYNDSKATTPSSMLAAVTSIAQKSGVDAHIPKKSLHLLMGGLSKGVDREPAIAQLGNYVKHVYCFGAEASHLYALCQKYGIPSSPHATLEDAYAQCITSVQHADSVLLSPGGASYDLFANYEERGAQFVALVKQALG